MVLHEIYGPLVKVGRNVHHTEAAITYWKELGELSVNNNDASCNTSMYLKCLLIIPFVFP